MAKKRTPAPVASGAGAADCLPGGDRKQHSNNHAETLADSLERIAAADRRWFEQHPRSRWRIRRTEPGEWPDDLPDYPWTAVRSVGIGRVRIPLTGSPPPGLTDRGIDRLMQEILPARGRSLIAELEAIAKESRP